MAAAPESGDAQEAAPDAPKAETIAEPEKNLGLINEAFHEFFPENPPVRSFSSSKVTQMGRDGILVQVGCIAYVD